MEHKVFEHKLSGGAKGLVVHVPSSKVVNLVIRFNSGFQFGDLEHYEMPHVLEHLIGTSTTHYPEHTSFKIELQKNGAYRNAATSNVANWYDFELAEFELERILDLQHEYFLETQFPDKAVEVELGNVRQELTGKSALPGHICYQAYAQAAYPARSMDYEKRLVQLSGITVKQLQDYFKRSHTPANMRVYLSGNFPDGGAAAIERLNKQLRDLPAGERFQPDWSPGLGFAPIAIKRDIKQDYYHVEWSQKELPRELEPAASILSALLGQGYGSRVHGNARHLGLAYHVSCEVGFGIGSSNLSFVGDVSPDNIEALLKLMADQMKEIKAGKVTDEEIETFKTLWIGTRIRAYQMGGQLLSWYIGEYEERDEIDDFDTWTERLRAVTKEQVIAVAKHVTAGASFGSAFVGPVTEADAQRFAKLLEPIGK